MLPESPPTPGRTKRRRKRLSDYGIRLREKQKLKFIYSVSERQFRRYFDKARRNPKNTELVLLQLLETRLDNVIYRLGFAKSRRQARQLINHGHVLTDDKKVDIPSYNIEAGQVITLKTKSLNLPLVTTAIKEVKTDALPTWLSRQGLVGRVSHLPKANEVRSDIDVHLIVEYYSR